MSVSPLASPSLYPRCPGCGLYFVNLPDHLLREAKTRFGWRIGHFDPKLPREQWDAVRIGWVQSCPRCNAFVNDVFRKHFQSYLDHPPRRRKRDKRDYGPQRAGQPNRGRRK